MAKKVLITGGSGLIGSALTQNLLLHGYEVGHLSRKKSNLLHVKTFVWDPEKGTIDEKALQGTSFIIHLAGAGVFDKRWSESYKREIINSREKSAALLLNSVKQGNHSLEAFVSASGIAIYGADTGEAQITESSKDGNGFLADVVKVWEAAADKFMDAGIRTVKIRTGIVLDKNGGALQQLVGPIKYGIGAPLGTGKQYIPWIHIDDLCEIYRYAIENKSQGIYNAASPYPVSNKEFTIEAAKILGKPLIAPNVPAFVLKIYLGSERADYILGGNRIVSPRIVNEGFKFKYSILSSALSGLLI